ncbi:serine hydrolase [Cytobacillus suaedae]|nr:serine hydrolase [Cytobacillus suaedae]
MDFELLRKSLKKEKINTTLISQNGSIIYEYYKNSKQKDKLHKINSCTKSVMSILFGIAIEKKYLESVHNPIHHYFPELLKGQEDKRKMEITIYHLLTMTDGLDFPEFGEWNCFAPMVYHHDSVKFVIDRPMIHSVGTHMNYSSGASHILSAILQQVTKMKTEEFAQKYLFQPLGIEKYQWYTDRMGINKGGDGLVFQVADMLKIGKMMLKKGEYNGIQILSKDWIEKSTTPNLLTYESIGHYGMHWWVSKIDSKEEFSESNTFYFALGFGGQYIIILPSTNMVIAVTSDIYDDSLKPLRILRSILFEKIVNEYTTKKR